ncbi:hypothetical protein [Psychrobacillus sp. FSL K6-1267]|uniref:hypothetical protein n=1 Tax=Psychrobacillus sp. FSL K6-1267 TaxID=2921543 RepID=UPI0030F788A9
MSTKATIYDNRPKWMQKEDKRYACQTFCKFSKKCTSNLGYTCKKLGGDVIPVILFQQKRK